MKRRILATLLAIALCFTCFPPFQVKAEAADATTGSVGLEYSLNDDGTYTVIGIGTCTDTDLVIPATYEGASVTAISDDAFCGCASLISVTIPDSVTSIGWDAFYECTSLTRVLIPDCVTRLGEGAFRGCSSLTSVTIPNSVTSILEQTFYDCISLTSVFIPESVTIIGWFAFENCTSLTEIHYGGTEAQWNAVEKESDWNTNTGDYTVFFESSAPVLESLEYTLAEDGQSYIVTGIGTCTDTDLVIPATYEGLPVTAIGNDAFWDNQNLTSVIVPGSVTEIGVQAFGACYNLKSVTLNEGLLSIGGSAFSDCTKLTHIDIPTTVTRIGDYAFAWCNSLADVYIPANVSFIGIDAFAWTSNVFTVAEENMTYCAVDGVLYSKDMQTLVVYPGVKTETSFTVPNGVTTIAENAFEASDSLTEIILPATLKTIEDAGFHNCMNLRSVTIPAGVTYIGDNVFENCDGMTEILVEEGNAFYCSQDGVLYDLEMTRLIRYPSSKQGTSFEIPYGVTEFPRGAFRGAEELVSVTIPATVTRLDPLSFQYCSNLKQVFIPAEVTYIGSRIFNWSVNVTDIYYAGSETQWNNITKDEQWNCIDFDGTLGSFTVHYGVDCELNGHQWIEATCVTPRCCVYCMVTDGDALGHHFENDTCTRCGLINYEGKLVRIYYPQNDFYMTTEPNGNGLYYGDIGSAAVWHVEMDDRGYLAFSVNGNYLTSGPAGNSLFLAAELSDCGLWEMTALDNGCCYLRNVGAAYNGNYNQYLEYYRNWFTTYGFNANNALNYTFRLVEVNPCEVNGHCWSDATCQQERSCTVCGIYSDMGDHDYVDGTCSVCGAKCSLGLEYMLEGDHYVVVGIGSCADSDLVIPATYNGLPVTKIGDEAFYENQQLTSLTLPGSIVTIGRRAFMHCGGLRNIILPEGLMSIGEHAFWNCYNLTSLTLPDSLKMIGNNAFGACNHLQSVTLGEGVVSIGREAFTSCGRLVQVNLPDSLVSIGNQAFSWCGALESFTVAEENPAYCAVNGVLYSKDMSTLLYYPAAKQDESFVVPETVTTICDTAFVNCFHLSEVVLPKNLITLGMQAFQDCRNLKSIELPATLQEIHYGAFRGCSSLTSVTIPAGVSYIDSGVFAGCTNLREILVEEGNNSHCSVDGVLYTSDMSSLVAYPAGKTAEHFAIAEGVTYIYSEAFAGCQYLKSIAFPASLTTINHSVFQSCESLEHLVLPEGITRIEGFAFEFCTKLKSITIPSSVTYIGHRVLQQCNAFQTVIYLGTTEQWNAIEKENEWNMLDWNGNAWDDRVIYAGNCVDGHQWVEATCTAPRTCTACGLTEGARVPHTFEGDTCVNCGFVNYDGKVVKIYYPGNDAYLTYYSNKFGRLDSGNADTAALWTVTVDENGYYRFCSNIGYLSAAGNNRSLHIAAEAVEDTLWELVPADNGYYLYNVLARQNGWTGACMYFINGYFSNYDFNQSDAAIYTFQLIVAEHCEVYGHSWSDATCQQEKTCIVCGVSGGMGDHQYVDYVCTVCGADCISDGLEYVLSIDGKSYIVAGLGACNDAELVIPDTYNGLPVTQIGPYAFSDCKQITGVNLPDSITVISEYAFAWCNNLTHVNIPAGVTEIGPSAFVWCSKLNEIEIPAAVTTIGESAFHGCSKLTEINIPASVNHIGEGVFGFCYKLTGIFVDPDNTAYCDVDGVLYSEDMTTLICYPASKKGTSYIVPDSVSTLAYRAFSFAEELVQITLPEGLVVINGHAFEGCANLQNIQIPSTVTEIGYGAFKSCYSFTSITIPAGVTFIGEGAFNMCVSLTEILIEEGNANYCLVDGVLYTADRKTLLAYPCSKPGTSFVVPAGTSSITRYAFSGSMNLQNVTIPGDVTRIEGSTFEGCHSLINVILSSGVTYIDNWAFGNCSQLTSITIPASVTYIGECAFYNCQNLSEILYQGTEENWNAIEKQEGWDQEAGAYTVIFHNPCAEGHNWVDATCTAPKTCAYCGTTEGDALGHVYENGKCTVCGEVDHGELIESGSCGSNVIWSFYEDGYLIFRGSGDMYEYDMSIGNTPWFKYAEQVKNVDIGGDITSICHFAFANCTQLTTAELPSSIVSIGHQTFSNCTNLQRIVVYGLRRAFSNSFYECPNLKEIYLCDAYYVGKDPSGFFETIGLTTFAERIYMPASLGSLSDAFAQSFTCTNGAEMVEMIGKSFILYTKKSHDMQEMEHLDPTCTEEGQTSYCCGDCGYVVTEMIAANGHSFDESYICTVCGYAATYLTECGLQLDELILTDDGVYRTADGHVVVIAVRAPTSWLGGNTLAEWVDMYGDAYFGLTYWDQLQGATNDDGFAVLTEESLVWILDVITSNPSYGESAKDLHNYLGIYIDRLHVHEHRAVITPPTCTENGFTTYTCTCGNSYTADVTPALGHQDQNKDFMCDNGCGTPMIPDLTITAEDANVLTGEWVSVTLWVEENPGFQGMSFYPVITDANGNEVFWNWEVDEGQYALGFEMNLGTMILLTADHNIADTGALLEIRFFVGEEVEVGDYTISFHLYQDECFNEKNEKVGVQLPEVHVNVRDVVYGDANGDGFVDLHDALLLRRYLANRDPDTGISLVVVEAGADANGDGVVDLHDALLVRRYLANRDPETGESIVILGPQ